MSIRQFYGDPCATFPSQFGFRHTAGHTKLHGSCSACMISRRFVVYLPSSSTHFADRVEFLFRSNSKTISKRTFCQFCLVSLLLSAIGCTGNARPTQTQTSATTTPTGVSARKSESVETELRFVEKASIKRSLTLPASGQALAVPECASDAGIFVGQTQRTIVRHNRVERNVAGIEIENIFGADVYENEATNNTGGLLVFSLPGLKQKNGSHCRAFKNHVYDNNHPNFANQGRTQLRHRSQQAR